MKRWMASVGVYLKRFYLLEHVYAKHSDLFDWRNREMLSAVRVTRECKRTHGTNESERHVTINWLKKVAEDVYGYWLKMNGFRTIRLDPRINT